MTAADYVLFIALVGAWLVLRVAMRCGYDANSKPGAMSRERALRIPAATFAVIPLVALSWR